MRKKVPKSVKYKEHLRKVLRHTNQAEKLMYCPEIKKIGIEWTEVERNRLREAEKLLSDAEEIVSEILASRIGKQAVREARWGDNVV